MAFGVPKMCASLSCVAQTSTIMLDKVQYYLDGSFCIGACSMLCVSIKRCNTSVVLQVRMRGNTPVLMEGSANLGLYGRF